jgi:hypothetical protein
MGISDFGKRNLIPTLWYVLNDYKQSLKGLNKKAQGKVLIAKQSNVALGSSTQKTTP